jgi:ppGpp synthetase/RelA/SpoT-type nucleotidyltranferase
MQKNTLKIFISSTFLDLVKEREAVVLAIEEAECLPIRMETFGPSSEPSQNFIKGKVANADVLLLVVGNRYGAISESDAISYTEIEYQQALALDLPILAFIADRSRLITANQVDHGLAHEKLNEFIKQLEKRHTVVFWRDAPELRHLVYRALVSEKLAKENAATSPKQERPKYIAPVDAEAENLQQIDAEVGGTGSGLGFDPIYSNLVDSLIEQYTKDIQFYATKTVEARSLIENYLKKLVLENKFLISHYQIESRPKRAVDLREKLLRPGKDGKYTKLLDVTDLIGVRVILYLEADLDVFNDAIEKEFFTYIIDRVDKGFDVDKVEFGYKSIHKIFVFPSDTETVFELQLRTMLQHTWAEIEHKYGYKAKYSEGEIRRSFGKVSALLNIADEIFDSIAELSAVLKAGGENYNTSNEDLSKKANELNALSLYGFLQNPERFLLKLFDGEESRLKIYPIGDLADFDEEMADISMLFASSGIDNLHSLEKMLTQNNERIKAALVSLVEHRVLLNTSISETAVLWVLIVIVMTKEYAQNDIQRAISVLAKYAGMDDDKAIKVVNLVINT